MAVQAYVFVTTASPGAKRVVQHVRRVAGVVRADALFGAPDILALDGVTDTETKVVRWV